METSVDQCPLCGTELSRIKFREIQSKLREEEQKKASEVAHAELATRQRLEQQFKLDLDKQKQAAEKRVRAEADQEIKKVAAERDHIAKKLKDAQEHEEEILKQAQQSAEKQRQKELAEQRQALETDKTLTLLKQEGKFNREREALQKKMQLMDKQLQKKTANELGDGAEIDLFEALRETFPGDKITRIPKGQAGAGILHEVLYKGESCGKVIVDSKNRQS